MGRGDDTLRELHVSLAMITLLLYILYMKIKAYKGQDHPNSLPHMGPYGTLLGLSSQAGHPNSLGPEAYHATLITDSIQKALQD